MTIIKLEKLSLSHKEAEAIELTLKLCEGIKREASDPFLKEIATQNLMYLNALYDCTEEMAN